MLGLKPSKRESEKEGKQGRGLMEAMQSALKSIFTNPVFIPYIIVNSLFPCSYQSDVAWRLSQLGGSHGLPFRSVPNLPTALTIGRLYS